MSFLRILKLCEIILMKKICDIDLCKILLGRRAKGCKQVFMQDSKVLEGKEMKKCLDLVHIFCILAIM